jgi:hypothetical protein
MNSSWSRQKDGVIETAVNGSGLRFPPRARNCSSLRSKRSPAATHTLDSSREPRESSTPVATTKSEP